jgi:hypothetical protein
LKPLYDFVVDCKACQAKLGAVQADLDDEKLKSPALGREPDDALRAARVGRHRASLVTHEIEEHSPFAKAAQGKRE